MFVLYENVLGVVLFVLCICMLE